MKVVTLVQALLVLTTSASLSACFDNEPQCISTGTHAGNALLQKQTELSRNTFSSITETGYQLIAARKSDENDTGTEVSSTWSSFIKKEATATRMSGLTGVLLGFCLCCCVAPAICSWCIVRTAGGCISKCLDDFGNSVAKGMLEKFDAECPEDEKAKYCSQEAKDKCDKIFDEADTDKNGTLDLQELKKPMKEFLHEIMSLDCAFKAFDANKSGTIDKSEFFELMKYVHFSSDQTKKEREQEPAVAVPYNNVQTNAY